MQNAFDLAGGKPHYLTRHPTEALIRRNTMTTHLKNAPSKTGNPSGPGRGNNPPAPKK